MMKIKNKIVVVNILIVLAIFFVDSQISVEREFIVDESGFIQALFCPYNNCSHVLIELINSSENSKCAFYDLKNQEIIFVLKNKKTNVLIYEDNYFGFGTKISGKGLMHNKFCVIDEKIVWTGSYNPTNSKNDNNVIIIESETIAANYLQEFEEIKNNKNIETKTKKIMFNNYSLENYFCPEDNCQKRVLSKLENAQESIYFLTFTFTDYEIAKVLVKKMREGVIVKGLMESFQNKYSVYNFLKESGVEVMLDNSPKFQHNKVFIIDNKTVITGSFNPTKAANTINDENILVLEQPEIVEAYLKLLLILVDQNDGKSLSIKPTNLPE